MLDNSRLLAAPVGQTFESSAHEALSPRQRLHLILLGVKDVAASTRFYEALGWKKSPAGNDGFCKFDLGGYALCLMSRDALAADSLQKDELGFSGIALIYLAETAAQVSQILAKAKLAGGTIVKPATRTHWGIAGYFKDPDGHLFEVDFEETWVFDDEHRLIVDQVNAN